MSNRIAYTLGLVLALIVVLVVALTPDTTLHEKPPAIAVCEAVACTEVVIEPETQPEVQPLLKTEPTSTSTVAELIEFYAAKNGADPNLSYWVAWCESQFKNVPNSGGATYGQGIYQFIQSTWDRRCEGDVWDIEDNINCGTKLLGLGELSHWQPYSGHCWLPKL